MEDDSQLISIKKSQSKADWSKKTTSRKSEVMNFGFHPENHCIKSWDQARQARCG